MKLQRQVIALSPRISRILEGRTIRLGQQGQMDESALSRYAVSEADLGEALRGAGMENQSDAKAIFLEPRGKISIVKGN